MHANRISPSNSHYSRPEISVSQALLHLIDHYQSNQTVCERIKKLFFLGVQNAHDKNELEEKWLSDPVVLTKYNVSLPPKDLMQEEKNPASSQLEEYKNALIHHYNVINNDEVRRYFETILSVETLHTDPMQDLSITDLQWHCSALESMLPTTEACRKFYSEEEQKTLPGTVLEVVNNILDGNLTHVKEGVTTDKFSGLEYSDALRKLKSKDSYVGFTEEQRTKMALLVRSSFLCVTILRHIPTLPFTFPMDLYKQGYYAIENRGALKKDSYETVKSSNLGLMLSYMWLPENDEAKSAEIVSYPRIADRNTIKYPSDWILDNSR